MKYIRLFSLLFCAFSAVMASAETVTVSTVEDLLSELRRLNGSSHTIQLEAGDYVMPAEAMSTNGTYGISSIEINKVKLVGLGATPADVRLIGNGNMRVIRMAASASVVQNLTITNGNATAKYNGYSNSDRGGGVVGSGTVTNCVITGCKAAIGGGAQASTKLWNSVVENCSASSGGGVHNCTAYSSIIRNNTAAGDGGGVYTATLYDCQVLDNACTGSAKRGGGGYNVSFATNTVFAGNRSTSHGGGVSNNDSSNPESNCLWRCTFSNNVSSAGSGGGAARVSLFGCTVVDNQANGGGGVYASHVYDSVIEWNRSVNGSGGGFMCSNGYAYWASNCVIRANRCKGTSTCYGGGIHGSTLIYDCEIYGNYAEHYYNEAGQCVAVGTGGGASGSQAVLRNCYIHDNYSDSYGGGIRGVTAIGCRIANNLAGDTGQNTYSAKLIGCDVSGTSVSGGSALNTDFHHIGGLVSIDNPYTNASATVGFVYMTYPNATNCLFRNTQMMADGGTLFCGVQDSKASSSLVNCTIVSNRVMYMFRYFSVADCPMNVINCVFVDNLYSNGTERRDLSTVSSGVSSEALHLDHVAYGVSSIANLDDYATGPLYVAATNRFGQTTGFQREKDAADPYALTVRSQFRGKGLVMDWMADATDFRGEGFARLRDGVADLGCYQCWLDPVGMVLLFR